MSDRVLGLGCSDLLGVDADHGGSRPEELAEAHGELVQASSDDERDICLLDHGHGFELSEAIRVRLQSSSSDKEEDDFI
ncbi:hypothetical protein [Halomonas sp. N3-2A]|uniref:hypothetical protein n=1 Tax=Halomonas sp. N3-2A TaxID=2014541 RepID=UPI000B5B395C|nr:hypothetical protein [Halomonas sp. N3-2A]ASK21737.1 hypothetical protein CEK60_21730 [Halomonas sp. N3-2A]